MRCKSTRGRATLGLSSAPRAFWRIRVGDYRIVYTIKDAELVVIALRVAHRSAVYRNF